MQHKRTSASPALESDELMSQRAELRATTRECSPKSKQLEKREKETEQDPLVDASTKQQSFALIATILVNALTLGTCISFSQLAHN